jgi:hypothetical protein
MLIQFRVSTFEFRVETESLAKAAKEAPENLASLSDIEYDRTSHPRSLESFATFARYTVGGRDLIRAFPL